MDIRLDTPTQSASSSPRGFSPRSFSTHLPGSSFQSPDSASSRQTLSPYSNSDRMIAPRVIVTEKELLENIDDLITETLIPAYMILKGRGGNTDTVRKTRIETAIVTLRSLVIANRQLMPTLKQKRRVVRQRSKRSSSRPRSSRRSKNRRRR